MVAQHRPVLDERALGEVGDVVEHAVRRVVVGAERRPRVGARRAPRHVTWLKPPCGTDTPISARPPTVSPGPGVRKYIAGACFWCFRSDVARHTTALSAGTVTVTRPSPSLRMSPVPTGHRPRNLPRSLNVSNVTVWSVSLLLAATTYSRSSVASMRLNA